jgi:hypothetical protein
MENVVEGIILWLRSPAEPQPTRLVGAGIALPSFHTTGKLKGKPSPYEMRKLSVKKTRIYGMTVQNAETRWAVNQPLVQAFFVRTS